MCARVMNATNAMAIDDGKNNDQLRKDVLVNNVRMSAYMDGGSKYWLIRPSSAKKMDHEESCDPIQLRGFGG